MGGGLRCTQFQLRGLGYGVYELRAFRGCRVVSSWDSSLLEMGGVVWADELTGQEISCRRLGDLRYLNHRIPD